MKHNYLLLMAIAFVLSLAFASCKKQEQETLTPKIKNDKVETTATTATFTWTVDWPGKLISVVEVSENEDMSDSQFYGSETETDNHNFSVTVSDLKEGTKYYYRYLVWNMFYVENKFSFEAKELVTGIGAYRGLFTINGSGDKVFFSQGNLQYFGSANTPYWKFAECQWDCLGDNGQGSVSQTLDRDLFGWGTSGYNHGAVCYQPWSTNCDSENYRAYGHRYCNLYDQTGQADWGYNAISNGGNQIGLWRTLTLEEWNYLIDTRSTKSGIRYVKGKINDICGIILLPDSWMENCYPLNAANNPDVDFDKNRMSFAQWNVLEQHGAIFLPATGYRDGTSVSSSNGFAYYWLSTCDEPFDSAYFIVISSGYFGSGRASGRSTGSFVRLVRDVE